MPTGAVGGFGTRIYFLANTGTDPKASQILKGTGYVTINLKGAHYRSSGTLWERIFGGTDKVALSTQVSHSSSSSSISGASIEEVREIKSGQPYYFGSNRTIALVLPTDCDAINMSVAISAVHNDNLGAALDILNSGELKGTLELAPPFLSAALTIANIVKKLLSTTDPQRSLQGEYDGRLSIAASDNPIRDFCLAQGTIILIYRESEDDTSLDDLDTASLVSDGDGLKYDGRLLPNTYLMFQVSFAGLRGEDPSAAWSSIFSSADQTLDQLINASSDAEKQKIWSAAFASFQQGAKLLFADATYTQSEAKGIAAVHLSDLKKKFEASSGQSMPSIASVLVIPNRLQTPPLLGDDFEAAAQDYRAHLARSNVTLSGPLNF